MDVNNSNTIRKWAFSGYSNGLYYTIGNVSDEFRILQAVWDLRLGREDFVASPLFPVIICVAFYFSLCTPFMLYDLYGSHLKSYQKYKIQPDKPVSVAHCIDTLTLTAWNHVLYILPASIAQWVWVPPTPLPQTAPTLFDFVFQQWAAMLIFDFQYFVWHWMHHRVRFLYKHIHALHHRYHSPFCWVTQYLHPWELITVGFLTTTNMWFFESHPLTTWSFMLMNIIVSVEAHVGFDFPFFPNNWVPLGLYGGSPKHDMHHQKPMTNFQPFFNHFDKIFGSYCPPMGPAGYKSPELNQYEARQKATRKQQ